MGETRQRSGRDPADGRWTSRRRRGDGTRGVGHRSPWLRALAREPDAVVDQARHEPAAYEHRVSENLRRGGGAKPRRGGHAGAGARETTTRYRRRWPELPADALRVRRSDAG